MVAPTTSDCVCSGGDARHNDGLLPGSRRPDGSSRRYSGRAHDDGDLRSGRANVLLRPGDPVSVGLRTDARDLLSTG